MTRTYDDIANDMIKNRQTIWQLPGWPWRRTHTSVHWVGPEVPDDSPLGLQIKALNVELNQLTAEMRGRFGEDWWPEEWRNCGINMLGHEKYTKPKFIK